MRSALKIILLVLAVLPLWLTIMAMGEESKLEALKSRLNSEFLKLTDRHIQVLEVQSRVKEIEALDLGAKLDVEITNLNTNGSSMLVLKNVDTSGRLIAIVRLPVKLFIEEQVSVATRDIHRLDIIDRDDFRTEWRDASQLRSAVAHSQDLKSPVAKTNIKEGSVILLNQLQKESMISRGDRVKVKVVGTGILLTVVGQAQEAGAKGQTIKVINTDSHKEFLGVVTDAKEVEVRL